MYADTAVDASVRRQSSKQLIGEVVVEDLLTEIVYYQKTFT